MRALPKKYRKNINIAEVEENINEIDSTVLNLGRGGLTVEEIRDNIGKELTSGDAIRESLNHMAEDLEIEEKYSDEIAMWDKMM